MELMQQNAPGLAAQEPLAEGWRRPNDGVSGPLRELFHTVCYMEEDAQGGHRGPPDFDDLHSSVYHALLISFLSKRAAHAAPSDLAAASEERRVARLQETLDNHTDGCPPLPYTIVGLCYALRSPATLVRHKATLYVACRGTQSYRELKTDLRTSLQQVNGVQGLTVGGRAYRGFLDTFNRQAEGLLARIGTYLQEEEVEGVVFCGHSLGGAVAQLLGVAYAQMPGRHVRSRVVSFGCPRVGDRVLQATLRAAIDHTRMFVRKEPFPSMPHRYAPHGGTNNPGAGSWELGRRREAVVRQAHEPTRSLCALALIYYRHRLTTYAAALKDHRSVREGVAQFGAELGEVAAA